MVEELNRMIVLIDEMIAIQRKTHQEIKDSIERIKSNRKASELLLQENKNLISSLLKTTEEAETSLPN
jgi:phage shock protein A